MWTLLSEAAQRSGNGGDRVASVAAARPANGSDTAALLRDLSQEVRVFMHPGRLELGVVDFARADTQFDLREARAFGSLEEAEPACAGRSGFLLQLTTAASRRGGDAVPATVLFVARLRR